MAWVQYEKEIDCDVQLRNEMLVADYGNVERITAKDSRQMAQI